MFLRYVLALCSCVMFLHVSEDLNLLWGNDFFDSAQFLQVAYHWPKIPLGKGISLAAFGVRYTSMLLQNGRKVTPFSDSKTSGTTACRFEVITPTFTDLSTELAT